MIVDAVLFDDKELHDNIITKVHQWLDGQIRDDEMLTLKLRTYGKCTLDLNQMLTLLGAVPVDDRTTFVEVHAHRTCSDVCIVIGPC